MNPLANLSCLQVWMPAINQEGLDALQKQLYSDSELCIMGSPALMAFRLSSCQSMQFGHQGMPGRVLKSGCVQVVQNLRIIPDVLHPRCRLPEAMAVGVGELLYIPVYDLHAPHAGPVAVLEALLSATATDSMLVANFISVMGNMLSCVQLSLSNPLPQPVRRSKLEGRKPRHIHPSSSQDLTHAQQHLQQQPQPQAPCHDQAGAEQAAFRPSQQQQSASAFAAGAACTPVSGCGSHPDCAAAAQLTSCSSGSAGTIVAAASAGTPTGSPVDGTLDSTLSSPLQDSCMGPVNASDAGRCCVSPRGSGSMPPPRPCAAATERSLHKHRLQHDGFAVGGEADDEASPPPCKLRRTGEADRPRAFASMARTKSMPYGLDQVLLEAMAGKLPTASC